MDETVSTDPAIETVAKKKRSISPRARNWLEGGIAAVAIAIVPVVHCLTVGNNKGFLLGTAESTIAGAMSVAILTLVGGGRIIDMARQNQVRNPILAAVIGTMLICAGATAVPLVGIDLKNRAEVQQAYLDGADALMRAGRIAETRPHEDVRKVTGAVTMELLVNSFRPTYADDKMKELDQKVSEKWKSLGFDKSPDL